MPRRKPQHYWWIEPSRQVPGMYRVKATGQLIPKRVVAAWDNRESRRMHRLERQQGKKEASDGTD